LAELSLDSQEKVMTVTDEQRAIVRIPLDEILADDEFNCRGVINPADVQDLAQDIAKLGLLQPIVVQRWKDVTNDKIKYRIICGHRRYYATKINRARKVPNSETIDCIVRIAVTDEQAYVLNVSENVKRKNLNIMQEALAVKRFYALGWSQEKIAEELKVLRPWIQVRVALLKLPQEIQQRAAADMLTQHQIMEIAALPTREEQMAACRAAINWKLQGNRGSLKIKKPKNKIKESNPFETGHVRTRQDIEAMQDSIQEAIGDDHIAARVLGWAAGYVSSADLAEDIQKIASEKGKSFRLPGEA
jgi:ParB/RepB/Spo0J family partition protein